MTLEEVFRRVQALENARPNEGLVGQIKFLSDLFVARHAVILDELLPAIQQRFDLPGFRVDVLRTLRRRLTNERRAIQKKADAAVAAGADVRFFDPQLAKLDEQIRLATDFDTYIAWASDESGLRDIYIELANGCCGGDQTGYVVDNFCLFHVASILYDEFVDAADLVDRFDGAASKQLEELYAKRSIDLAATDHQFAKYGLLSFRKGMLLDDATPVCTIHDPDAAATFVIDVPQQLVKAIRDAVARGYINDVSFHVSSVGDLRIALEELEFGGVFAFDALKLPSLSKLYDLEGPENALWIKVEKSQPSITFEELREDFAEINGHVVTQVVHLEFGADAKGYFVSHIDHEYILYTLELYADRLGDSGTKGHKKLKTFKIDNARIPFDHRHDGHLFLFMVLDSYFKNKDLVKEYFERVQQEE